MAKVGVQQAWEDGKKAYSDGRDINNIPGHYTDIERELFLNGYEEAQSKDHEELFDEGYDDYDESEVDELDFDDK